MRRKRRIKYSWIQPIGTSIGATAHGLNVRFRQVTAPAGFDSSTDQVYDTVAIDPVVLDRPADEVSITDEDVRMADQIGSDYILRRVVGKVWVEAQQLEAQVGETVPHDTYCTAGLFVARADHDNPNVPIGAGGAGASELIERFTSYSPLSTGAIKEPWIWRRTWKLSNVVNATTAGDQQAQGLNPRSNTGYGSVLDGPHIDAKTVRRIGQDDRLWMVSTWFSDLTFASVESDYSVFFSWDLRLLARLTKRRQRGTF